MNPLVEKWNQENRIYHEKEEKLHDAVIRAERRLAKHQKTYRGWVDGIVEPLAKELAALRGMNYEIFGPFGLRCETSIHLTPKGSNGSIIRNPTWSITLTPRDPDTGDFNIAYDTGRTKGSEYPPGTIGYCNHFAKETAPLPDTLEEINALLRFSPGLGGEDKK